MRIGVWIDLSFDYLPLSLSPPSPRMSHWPFSWLFATVELSSPPWARSDVAFLTIPSAERISPVILNFVLKDFSSSLFVLLGL